MTTEHTLSDDPADIDALNASAAAINGDACMCPSCHDSRQDARIADIEQRLVNIERLAKLIEQATRPDSGNGIEILARPGVGQ